MWTPPRRGGARSGFGQGNGTGNQPALCRKVEEAARNRPSGNEGRRADRKGRTKEELPGSREPGWVCTGRRWSEGLTHYREDVNWQRRNDVDWNSVEPVPRWFPSCGARRAQALSVRSGVVVRAMFMVAGPGVTVIVVVVILVDLVDQPEVLQVHVG